MNLKNSFMRIPGISMIAVSAILAFSCGKVAGLQIGIAEVDYTPQAGLDLAGNYRGDDYASRGIHDPLYARALVARGTDGKKVAVLSIDICWMRRETVEMMRGYIAANSDIEPGRILITATHTHSGPKSLLDAPHAVEYLQKAASAVLEADERLRPSRLRAGKAGQENSSFNRRLWCADGRIHMCWERPEPGFVVDFAGPKDPEVVVLEVRQDGRSAGYLVNFGCHATTLTGNNWLYSADYPGYLAVALKEAKGEGFVPLFVNGACGDVTQVDYRRGFIDTYEECERIGRMLGDSAMEAMEHAEEVKSGGVDVLTRGIPLKRITITEEQRAWAEQVMRRVAKHGMPPPQADGIPDEQYAGEWLELYEVQHVTDTLELMTVRIGDVALVGLPGEFFAEFGLRIKEGSPFPVTIVAGLANDNRKYFPTAVSFTQGPEGFTPGTTGYETTPGTTLYEPGSGEKVVDAAIAQLRELYRGMLKEQKYSPRK